jgi:hypothetical protein
VGILNDEINLTYYLPGSVAVNFYTVFKGDAFFNQKLEYVASMIALKLNNCAPFFMLHCSAVAAPCFLE